MFLFLVPILLPLISTTSFYVLNDFHFDPNYSPEYNPTQNLCRGNVSIEELSKLYEEFPSLRVHHYKSLESNRYGQYGCDSPFELIKIMLDELLHLDEFPDIIYLNGDFVGHGYSQEVANVFSNDTFNLERDIIVNISQEVKIRFPNTLIIPSIGNNDPEFHYQVPENHVKSKFYEFLFDTWFIDHIPNSKLANLDEIKSTFLNGGYFRIDYNDELTILTLNTLFFSKYNNENNDPNAAADQFYWLKSNLAEIKANQPNRRVLINYHVFPGYSYNGKGSSKWNDSYVVQIDQIFQEYNDIILTIISAHIHANSLRSYRTEPSTNTNFLSNNPSYATTFICPSVTPISLNNPGFSLITLEQQNELYQIDTLKFHYLNLEKLNNDSVISDITEFSKYFFDINIKEEYGLVDFSSETVGKFIEKLEKDDDFLKKYLVLTLGYPLEEFYNDQALKIFSELGLVIKGEEMWEIQAEEKDKYICTLKHMKQDHYEACSN